MTDTLGCALFWGLGGLVSSNPGALRAGDTRSWGPLGGPLEGASWGRGHLRAVGGPLRGVSGPLTSLCAGSGIGRDGVAEGRRGSGKEGPPGGGDLGARGQVSLVEGQRVSSHQRDSSSSCV